MIGRLALALAAMAAPAAAQVVSFPKECTGVVTVQSADCSVLAAARCVYDGQEVLRTQVYDVDGLENIEEQTLDWSLRFSVTPRDGTGIVLNDAEHDELSRDSLQRYGEDFFNYDIVFAVPGMGEFDTELTGMMVSQGEEVEIDGHTLDLYRFRLAATLGEAGTLEVDQTAYGSAEFGLFLNGKGVQRFDGAESELNSTPVLFFEPGEAGFDSAAPKINCGVTDISAPLLLPDVQVPGNGA